MTTVEDPTLYFLAEAVPPKDLKAPEDTPHTVAPEELRFHLAAIEKGVRGKLVNKRWRVPASSQSADWTAARITEDDGTEWTISTMGIRAGGTHIQIERQDTDGSERLEATIPLSTTNPHEVRPNITLRRRNRDGHSQLIPNSKETVTAAKILMAKLAQLNGSVVRVENIISSKRLVFDAAVHGAKKP